MDTINRRSFLLTGAAGLSAIAAGHAAADPGEAARLGAQARPDAAVRPTVVSSGNGIPAVTRAMQLLREGADPIDAVVEGITIVEDDPHDMSVGYGGLPNEEGVIELDACVMHGPSHKAGSVAGLQNIRNPAKVALLVLRKTNHVLLVGEGAKRFALKHGFEEENLLTDRARQAWERWRSREDRQTDWLGEDEQGDVDIVPLRSDLSRNSDRDDDVPHTTGTIHCAAVNESGDLGACTSTSGLSWKIAGRVGDSPIIGAGNFVDNLVGAAGATGRGESVIKSCGAFQIVNHMANGLDPTEACLKTLKWIADHTRRNRLRNERGEPNFQVTFYALRKDGAHGSASMRKGARYVIHDGEESKSLESACLFE